ncbi:alcohol dehydrogenase GroES domain protein [Hyaloraphidium curvatum]|nr:alcohol dehydrogenase GroES domain protein [Hyaloraphidium curvatum]
MAPSKKLSMKYPARGWPVVPARAQPHTPTPNPDGEPLVLVEEDLPVPAGKQVLLRVTSAGACHSDIHLHEGLLDVGAKIPWATMGVPTANHVMGHEIAGTVVAKGPDADVEIGSSVVAWPWMGCMKADCEDCMAGNFGCSNGSNWLGCQQDGGYATHCLVPEDRYCLPYASRVSEEFAATMACSGLTAYGAVKRALGGLPKGFSDAAPLLIVGAGGLGLQAVGVVRALFPEYKPAVADIDTKKREVAVEAGAGLAIDPADAEQMAKLSPLGGGPGFVRVIDFVGNGKSIETAVALGRLNACKIVVCGLFGGNATIPVSRFVLGLQIAGHGAGSVTDLKELLALAGEGKIKSLPIQKRKLGDSLSFLPFFPPPFLPVARIGQSRHVQD